MTHQLSKSKPTWLMAPAAEPSVDPTVSQESYSAAAENGKNAGLAPPMWVPNGGGTWNAVEAQLPVVFEHAS